MICRNCNNKDGFLVMATDYKPLEMWEFSVGMLTRYCQKDAGDIEMSVQCAVCGSEDVDTEGFDTGMYTDRPLVILSDEEWEEKVGEFKKEETVTEKEEGHEKQQKETAGGEKAEEEPEHAEEEKKEEGKEK